MWSASAGRWRTTWSAATKPVAAPTVCRRFSQPLPTSAEVGARRLDLDGPRRVPHPAVGRRRRRARRGCGTREGGASSARRPSSAQSPGAELRRSPVRSNVLLVRSGSADRCPSGRLGVGSDVAGLDDPCFVCGEPSGVLHQVLDRRAGRGAGGVVGPPGGRSGTVGQGQPRGSAGAAGGP